MREEFKCLLSLQIWNVDCRSVNCNCRQCESNKESKREGESRRSHGSPISVQIRSKYSYTIHMCVRFNQVWLHAVPFSMCFKNVFIHFNFDKRLTSDHTINWPLFSTHIHAHTASFARFNTLYTVRTFTLSFSLSLSRIYRFVNIFDPTHAYSIINNCRVVHEIQVRYSIYRYTPNKKHQQSQRWRKKKREGKNRIYFIVIVCIWRMGNKKSHTVKVRPQQMEQKKIWKETCDDAI